MQDVYLIDLVCSISAALDYVSPTVNGHHKRVGIGSADLGRHMGYSPSEVTDLLMAGLMHDIGIFTQDVVFDGFDFDDHLNEHSAIGYRLLVGHPLLEKAAVLVLHHHTRWKDLQSRDDVDQDLVLMSNIVNFVDRVDILRSVGTKQHDWDTVRKVVSRYPAKLYAPEVIEAFLDLSADHAFRERIDNRDKEAQCLVKGWTQERIIPHDQLLDFSGFFSHIIDFRSRHTATHSQGVAETAVQLAQLAGMDQADQRKMRLAGNLHDIGKLAVSSRLLDKPAALNSYEYSAVQDHATVCEMMLRSVPGLDEVADWACQHHERLNGKGYPHGLVAEELSLGGRIMQEAEVHTAITEDRPYRLGMPQEKVAAVMNSMANKGFLDSEIVGLALDNHEQIDAIRRMVQSRAAAAFRRFSDYDHY